MPFIRDEELKIDLTELQADIQINLTIFLGFFAGLLTDIIGFEQIFLTLRSEQLFEKISVALLASIIGIVFVFVIWSLAKRIETLRKQITQVAKKHLW